MGGFMVAGEVKGEVEDGKLAVDIFILFPKALKQTTRLNLLQEEICKGEKLCHSHQNTLFSKIVTLKG
jgi:hypothetical protein